MSHPVQENTCFYFDCRAEALPDALKRFSSFFKSPLFAVTLLGKLVQSTDDFGSCR